MANQYLKNIPRVSRLFQPINIITRAGISKHDITLKSYRLMLDMGIIRQSNTGMYTLLPLGLRVLQKLINIVDNEMTKIGAQKLLLPSLTNTSLWEKTNTQENISSELFTLQDRHQKNFILGPTYEAAMTDLVAHLGDVSSKRLPIMLYQISTKWRDEMKPRLGLFRGREFIMKDLYTFDVNMENAQKTYKTVREAYENIFKHIGIEYTIAVGDTGVIGGTLSHEYNYLSEIGEDTILSCDSCGFHANSNIYDKNSCPTCDGTLTKRKAVEVAHTFLLGERYSKPLNANVVVAGVQKPLMMGCYGLGLTRLVATTVQSLSLDEELRWPKNLAPYTVCVIPPKEKSRTESASRYLEEICEILSNANIDTILDDRIDSTIGRRFIDAKRTGYPYIVILGKSAIESPAQFEIHDLNNSQQINVTMEGLKDFFENNGSAQERLRVESVG